MGSDWNKHGLPRPALSSGGLPDVRKLRQYAKRCRRFARASKDPNAKSNFLEMAAAWLMFAAQVERTEALLDRLHASPHESVH